MTKSNLEIWEWLQSGPSLAALAEAYPAEWAQVEAELAAVVATSERARIKELALRAAEQCRAHPLRMTARSGGRVTDAAVRQRARAQMLDLAIRQYSLAAATGVKSGKVRFDWFNGLVAQRLFFRRGLERKPVSLRWFRLLWPLLWQKRRLMPLVESRGIYCFYSDALISGLVELIGSRRCHEIAAGDGTLTRFLAARGVAITASDNASWSKAVQYPADVLRLDAREAIQRFQPEVVICCWPPSGNGFERHVFRQRSVDTYILIGSREQHVAGNWEEYRQQDAFDWQEATALSPLVLPPELNPGVYIFQRKAKSHSA